MDAKQRLDALEVALQNEMNEREFYLRHAGRTQNPVGKVMFEMIADDELEHYERLKALHERWQKSHKWPETVPLSVRHTDIQAVLKELIAKVEDVPTADTDDLEAIKVASAFEAKGAQAYMELSKGVTDAKERSFFELLASMEREHYLSLKDAEEYMMDPSSWFARKERHGLDGA